MKLVTMKELVRHDSQEFHKGEVRMVDDDTAELFCRHGWAISDGLVTGDRVPGLAELDVQSGSHPSKTKVG
jgi:hypothetical protein